MISSRAHTALSLVFPATLVFLCPLFLPGRADAQATVTATVDRNQVAVGEQVVLTISVSVSGDVPNVEPPKLPNMPGVGVAGPHGPSTSQSITVVGGQASRRTTLSYLYYLAPQRPGEIVIPVLKVVVDGQVQETRPIRLVVTKPGEGVGAETPVEMRVRVSRATAYQGQEIVVEYLMYERNTGSARVGNRQISQEPTFTGFWVETLLDARKDQVHQRQEITNGVSYAVIPVLRLAVFPTTSGALTIPSVGLTAAVAMPTGTRNFWGDPVYRQTVLTVNSPERTVEVRPLPPNAPAGFGGGVGSFRLTSRVDRAGVTQGDPVTWTVTLEGEGNLKAAGDLIIPPLEEFRAYDAQVTTAYSSSAEHYGGKKTYERVLIPLHPGPQDIPPASFAFFDPEDGQYRTISSDRHPLSVAPSKASQGASLTIGLTQAEIRQVGSDIRFIKPDAVVLADETRTIWRARWYWAIQAIPLAFVLAALGVRWRQTYLGGDPQRMRAIGARGEARKRLKAGHALLKKGDMVGMASALGHATAEFIAGHASVSASGLTSERVREILDERKVPPQLIEEALSVLDRCDRARFAPRAVTRPVAEELYERCYALIGNLTRHMTT